ncbi:hypothetical protein COOONC_22904 [Cooperia oncophora]
MICDALIVSHLAKTHQRDMIHRQPDDFCSSSTGMDQEVQANAASVKSMMASQMMQKREVEDKNFLTYIGNVPEHIGVLMMHARRFRR